MSETKIYEARVGAPFKAEDAQPIGEFIEKHSGESTTKILEEIRRNPKHPIHNYIEWNDKKASEEYRLHQVRNIVNHITITIKNVNNDPPIRAFYNVKESSTTIGKIYVTLNTAMSEEYYHTQIIERAKTEIQHWMDRYRQYNELQSIINLIEEELPKLEAKPKKKPTREKPIVEIESPAS